MHASSLDQLAQLVHHDPQLCASVYLDLRSWPLPMMERQQMAGTWLRGKLTQVKNRVPAEAFSAMERQLAQLMDLVIASSERQTLCAFVFSEAIYFAYVPMPIDDQFLLGQVAHIAPLLRLRQACPRAVVVQQDKCVVRILRFAWGDLTEMTVMPWPATMESLRRSVRKELYHQSQHEPTVPHPVILMGDEEFLDMWHRETEFSPLIFYPSHLLEGQLERVVMILLEQAMDEEIGSLAQSAYRGVMEGTGVVGYGAIQAALHMKNLESLLVAEDLQAPPSRRTPITVPKPQWDKADAARSVTEQDALIKDCMARGIDVYFLPQSKMPEQLPMLGGLRAGFSHPNALEHQSSYLQ